MGGTGNATFDGPQNVHEAGHAFGLEHVYRQNTGSPPPAGFGAAYDMLHQSEIMSYLGYNSQGGFNFFSRFPVMDGDGNSDQNDLANSPTPYGDMVDDPNIGASGIEYVTGSGAHDIITITKTGATTANVSLQSFTDAAYTSAIDFPGATGTTYSYAIDTDRPLTIDAGGRNDRIILDGDLDTTITLRGMHGTDELIVMGKNAGSAVYTTGTNSADGLDGNDDLRGSVALGGTVINFQELEDASKVTVQDVGMLTYRTAGSRDDITLDSPSAGRMRLDGTSDLVDLVGLEFFNIGALTIDTAANDGASADDEVLIATGPLAGLNSIAVSTGAGGDELDVNFAAGNAIPAGGLSFNAGAGVDPDDVLNLRGGSFGTEVYTPSGPHSGSIVLDGTSTITYSNLAPINDTVTVANFTFNATGGNDVINVIDSTTFNGFDTSQINSGNGTFELVNFANKTTVRVQGQNGADTFHVSGVDPAAGLTELILHGEDQANAGDDNASDTVNLTGAFPGPPTRVFSGGGGDVLNFTGSGAGAGSSVFLSGDSGDDKFNVTASANAPLSVNGGGGSGDVLAVDGEGASFVVTDLAFSSAVLQDITYTTVERLVSDGTFEVSGVVTTPFHVNAAGTLVGTGTASGGVTVNAGGTVSPGIAGPGVLGSGDLLFAGGTYAVDIDGTTPGTEHDQLDVTGSVDLGAGVATLTAAVGYGSLPGDEIVIIRNDGLDAVSGFFAGAPQGAIFDFGGGQKFTIDYTFDADGAGLAFNDVALIRYGAQLAPDPCDPTKTALFVSATAAADDIQIVPATGNARGRVLINGVDEGGFRWDGYLYVMGQNGDDTIAVTMPSRGAFIYGQTGNDFLTAANNDSILIGGFGDDVLQAGNGKDILIGGAGADVLRAENGTDILIAGGTTSDGVSAANRHTLCHAAETWKHGGKPDDLAGVFNAATLLNDNEVDQLFGGHGKDWLILNDSGGGVLDLADADGKETVTDLD